MERLAVATWLRLMRVYTKLDRALSTQLHEEWGLSHAHFDVLAHVGANEGMTQQELADRLLVTKGNVCQLLDRLTASGLLVRQQDGRANRLFLTERGRSLYEEIVPRHEANIAELLTPLSPQEQIQLDGLLRKLDRSCIAVSHPETEE
jgi:DNA-binding MarR family transcriptional regulator